MLMDLNRNQLQTLRQTFNFAVTLKHPTALAGHVEMIPIDWMVALANPDANPMGELADGSTADYESLWQDMLKNGMQKPFMLAAGRHTGDCRLTAGNRRVQIFKEKGVLFVPTAAIVADDCKLAGTIGDQRVKCNLRIPQQPYSLAPFDDHIRMKPSEVFVELAEMKANGLIPELPSYR